MSSEMPAARALELLDALQAAGVPTWVDGGWGIDALVGTQTRSHTDLDVAIERDRCSDAVAALSPLGFAHDPAAEPGLPARYVLAAVDGRQVDLHLLAFDAAGNGWQQLGACAWGLYPEDQLGHRGTIESGTVRCIGPELQLRFHLGWEWDERAKHDMRVLADAYEIPLPPTLDARSGMG